MMKSLNKLYHFDPKTKIKLSDKNCCLPNIILQRIINTLCSNLYKEINKSFNIITQSKLELLMEFSKKSNSYLESLLYKYSARTRLNKDNFELPKIYDELINNTEIDFVKYIEETTHLEFILIKLLILNNVFDNFVSILDIIYFRSNIPVISMISILRLELLNINLTQLKKIIYYGRYDVFELLYFHIPYKVPPILKESKPHDFSGFDINYTKDINGSSYWGNDENDRSIIGKKIIYH